MKLETFSSTNRRTFLRRSAMSLAVVSFSQSAWRSLAQQRSTSQGVSPHYTEPPLCWRVPGTHMRVDGPAGHYLEAATEHWLKVAPAANPAMLEMFRDRDRKPLRDMVPWAGEFAGKYLTAAVQVLRVREDKELHARIDRFVQDLIACQDKDGYLGPWPRGSRLTGHAPNVGPKGGATWDAWGHYHVMLGLMLWHEESGSAKALASARRIADLFCSTFTDKRLVDTGSTEMNLAPIHSIAMLHARTQEKPYLKAAEKIRDEFAAKGSDGKHLAGDYLNAPLAGTEFFQTPKPRWESLHPIMGLAELYWITGEDRYRKAFEHTWWSIVKLDRHNNGGFSSGEQAQGNPYHPGAIETCCTIAWIAMSVEMLKMTANSIVADEIELATLNSVLGLHSPSGRWVTYNTPMDGVRKASAHDIVFQSREGTPELNCCSVNGARGLGMISDWAVMRSNSAVIVNWYGPSTMKVPLSNGDFVTLRQETDYPRGNRVRLFVEPSRPRLFPLKLRIPYWSRNTKISVAGQPVPTVAAGDYFLAERMWRSETIDIEFDFSPHFWAGEKECDGKASAYRGPLLLTYDRRLNDIDPEALPELDAMAPLKTNIAAQGMEAIVVVDVPTTDGKTLRLCDFASAGQAGSPYKSWLKWKNVPTTQFSRGNPLRSSRTALKA